MDEESIEQRRATRLRARVRVLYFSKGQPRAVDADCENISAEGLFVRTRRRGPEPGTPVSLILRFDGTDQEIMVEGIVRWQGDVDPVDNGVANAGMGIQFTEMDANVRDTLHKSLRSLPRANNAP